MSDRLYITMIMLALLGFALTAQTAFATNESSYRVGYSIAIDQYDGCNDTPDTTCPGHYTAVHSCYKGVTSILVKTSEPVTNSTACMDGYVNGFKHWCRVNVKSCVDIVTVCGNGDCMPGVYINQNKTAIKEASSAPESQLLGTWNFVNESSGVSGTITFTITLVGQLDYSNQYFNQTIDGKTLLEPGDWMHATGQWGLYSKYGWSSPYGHTLNLDYFANRSHDMTFTIKSPNHIELTDKHDNIVQLLRDNSTSNLTD